MEFVFLIERLDALHMCACFWLREYASIIFLNVGGAALHKSWLLLLLLPVDIDMCL